MKDFIRIMRSPEGDGGGAGGAGGGDGSSGTQDDNGGHGGASGAASGASGAPQGYKGSSGDGAQFSVPKEYAEKGWAKKVKNIDDVYKQLDNLDSVAGKKQVIPDLSKSDDPAVQEYLKNLIGGTKETDYTFTEHTPEAIRPAIAKILIESHIPPTMANKLIEGYTKMEQDAKAKAFSAEGFTAEMEKAFGKDHAQKSGEAVNFVSEMLDADGKKFFETQIPNHIVGFVYKLVNAVKAKYGASESGAGGEGGEGHGAGKDISEVRSDLRKQLREIDSRSHTAAEKKAIQDKLDATYK